MPHLPFMAGHDKRCTSSETHCNNMKKLQSLIPVRNDHSIDTYTAHFIAFVNHDEGCISSEAHCNTMSKLASFHFTALINIISILSLLAGCDTDCTPLLSVPHAHSLPSIMPLSANQYCRCCHFWQVVIKDAVPCFHLTVLAPMLEVACSLVEAYAKEAAGGSLSLVRGSI